MLKSFLMTSCALVVLTGCSLIPDYHRPALPTPAAWPADAGAKAAGPVGPLGWENFFTDPALRSLIREALDNNRDLKVAALNIVVARASYRQAYDALFPELDVNGNESEQGIAKSLDYYTQPPKSIVMRSYGLNVGVSSYELDLFGRLSSLSEQARESLLATEAAQRVTRITLVAEVANAYLTLLGDQQLLDLANRTAESRAASLELIRQSAARGVSSALDEAQADSLLQTARADQARYRRQVAQDGNALDLLLGKPAPAALLSRGLDQIRMPDHLAPGLPSDLLLHRPDIREAEFQLLAANANIGAARADFFPSISLTGTYGLGSASLSGLFQGGAKAWTFSPGISLPIFDMGSRYAALNSAKASRDIAVAQYEKAIQTGFREVADGLAAQAGYADQMRAQTAQVAAARTSLALSQARYDQGVDSFLTLQDAERTLYSAQQSETSLKVTELSNMVTLFKALGGGV